jgi:hypothetical protein
MRLPALLILPFLLALTDPGPFVVIDFGPQGRVTRTDFVDLHGDGRCEILRFSNRLLRLYSLNDQGVYDPAAPVMREMPAEALFFDLGQVDEDPDTLELAAVTPEGVVAVSFAPGTYESKSRLVLPARSLVVAPEEGNLKRRDFLRELDGDGMVDVVLPTTEGFALYFQRESAPGKPGKWLPEPDQVIKARLHYRLTVKPGLLGGLKGKVGVPEFIVRDFNGDGRADFAIDDGTHLRIHSAEGERGFAAEPGKVLDLSVLAGPDGEIPRFKLADVNADGLPDFLITRRSSGVTDVHLFGRPLTDPPLRIKLPGWSFSPNLADLDGDGKLDLIVPSTPDIGVSTAMSVMMTGALTVTNHIFLNTGDTDQPFKKEPDEARDLRVKMRLFVDLTGSIRAAHSVLVDVQGDFNGDGRKDLVYRSGSDEILIFPGQEEEVFDDSAARTVEIPDTDAFEDLGTVVRDLNGDGRTDLAIICRSPDRKGDSLIVLLSTEEEQE